MKRALLLLSAGIKQNEHGEWESTDLVEHDGFQGASGGKVRVRAAAYLHQSGDYDVVIAPGGHGHDKNIAGVNHPGLYEILKRELGQYGVPEEVIVGKDDSNTTLEQLLSALSTAVQQGVGDVTIVTSRYHLTRVQAMIEHMTNYAQKLGIDHVHYLAAEDVCIEAAPSEWEQRVEEAYASKQVQERVALELKGVQDIKQGSYNK